MLGSSEFLGEAGHSGAWGMQNLPVREYLNILTCRRVILLSR